MAADPFSLAIEPAAWSELGQLRRDNFVAVNDLLAQFIQDPGPQQLGRSRKSLVTGKLTAVVEVDWGARVVHLLSVHRAP